MNATEEKKQVLDTKNPSSDSASFGRGQVVAVLEAADIEDLKIDGLDPTFEAKAELVNHAVQAIGMGKYQWMLFCVTGFGWLVDQVTR